MLDLQVHYLNDLGLSKLGSWLHKRNKDCFECLRLAEEELHKLGIPSDDLEREWNAQIEYQTKPLPRKLFCLV